MPYLGGVDALILAGQWERPAHSGDHGKRFTASHKTAGLLATSQLLPFWSLLLIAYTNSFQSGLVFDNSSIIGQDPRIREATLQNIASIRFKNRVRQWQVATIRKSHRIK
jgi:hypothetical protein